MPSRDPADLVERRVDLRRQIVGIGSAVGVI